MGTDTKEMNRLLGHTVAQLKAIAKNKSIDPDQRRAKFMSVVQPTFYMLGRHYPELENVLNRIGAAFCEV